MFVHKGTTCTSLFYSISKQVCPFLVLDDKVAVIFFSRSLQMFKIFVIMLQVAEVSKCFLNWWILCYLL